MLKCRRRSLLQGMHASSMGSENKFPLMEGGMPGPPGLGGIQNMAMRMQGSGSFAAPLHFEMLESCGHC